MEDPVARRTIDAFGKSQKFRGSPTTQILVFALLFGFLAWFVRYLWSRRKFYLYSYRLPGPLALPFIGSALSFLGNPYDIYATISYMFDMYPGLFRVWFGNRLFYCVSDPKYHEILLNHPHALEKEYLYKMTQTLVETGLFTAPVKKWKIHRKVILPAFNPKILKQFVLVFSKHAEEFVQELEQLVGEEIDLMHHVSSRTMKIVCETTMGFKIDDGDASSEFPKWVDRLAAICMMKIFNIPYHNDTFYSMLPMAKEEQELCRKMRAVTNKIIQEKRLAYEEKLKKLANNEYEEEHEPTWKTFLDLLLEVSNFTDDDIRGEVNTLMVAGSDTTANTMSFAYTLLGMHQDIQHKVYEEIMRVVGPERSVEETDLPNLKYLELVLKETMRLFPPGPFIVRALTEDIKLDGHTLAAGSSVVFGIRRTHTDEKYWPDPFKFDPDRFLPSECAKRHPCAFIPFSYGPRNCIGLRYGMMTMKVMLATVLRKYRCHSRYTKVEDIKVASNLFIRPVDGHKTFFEARE